MRGEIGARGKPPDDIPDATTNIDDAQRARNAVGLKCVEDHGEKFEDALAVKELFREALHFPVDGEEKVVNGLGIESAVAGRNGAYGGDGLMIAESCESVEDVIFVDREAVESCGVVRDDEVGDFRLRGIEMQREHMGRA